MFKFLRKKLIEGIVKDIINELPRFRMAAKLIFIEKKDELLAKVEQAIIKTVKDFFDKEV